ncbi:MAG: TRAP transporter substrate-binding protein [Inquilinaceae bacterium]
MKTLWIAAGVAGLMTTLVAGPSVAQDVTLRLHQFLPAQATIPAKALTPWAEKVEADSGGRIEVEMFPSMQLGGAPPTLYDQARDGVVDLTWTVLGYTPGRFPKSEVFEMPFLVTSGEATSRAFQEYVEANAMDEFQDVKIIAVHTHGPGLFHSKAPIARLEDLEGLKIRAGSRVTNDMLTQLGAAAVGMPVPAVPEALSKGVIDAATIPWEVTSALKTSELVSHHTGFQGDHGLYTQTFVFAMNKDAYEALPDDLRAVIDANSGIEVAAMMGRVMDEGDAGGRATAEARGNTITMLDEAETQRWRDAAQVTIDNWIADAETQGFDGRALYDQALALVEKHSGAQ